MQKKDFPKLLNCPFCGGKAFISGYVIFGVECNDCGVKTPRKYETHEAAAEAWNRRAKNDETDL